MKQKNIILMVVAVGCGLVAAFLTTQIGAKQKVEQVEVLVAAKDLSVGTLMSKSDMPKLVKKKLMNKDSLPPNFVTDENELIDKRLSTPVQAEQVFNPASLSTKGVIILPEGKDMVSLAVNPSHAAAGFAGPGSHVDILCALKIKDKLYTFPLLVDMQILTVDTHTSYEKNGVFPNMNMISLAVTQEQALVLQMAKQRGCQLEILLRHPNKPIDPKYDMAKVKKILQDDSGGGITSTEPAETPRDKPTPADVVPPTPTPVAEMVKLLRANSDIPANTEVTKDLIASSFTEKEFPKDQADSLQGYTDLTPVLGQVFKTPVVKDQLVVKGMIGPASPKGPPPDVFVPNKPEPEKKVEKPANRIHDLAGHTPGGTKVYRYEEVAPGDWRLIKVMTPEEANREMKQSGAEATPAPVTPEKTPDAGARKID